MNSKIHKISCTECRRKKVKCNRLFPCDQCLKKNQQDECFFASRAKRRRPEINPEYNNKDGNKHREKNDQQHKNFETELDHSLNDDVHSVDNFNSLVSCNKSSKTATQAATQGMDHGQLSGMIFPDGRSMVSDEQLEESGIYSTYSYGSGEHSDHWLAKQFPSLPSSEPSTETEKFSNDSTSLGWDSQDAIGGFSSIMFTTYEATYAHQSKDKDDDNLQE